MQRDNLITSEVPVGVCVPRNASRSNSPTPTNCPPGTVSQGGGSLRLESRSHSDRHRSRTAMILIVIITGVLFPEAYYCCVIGIGIIAVVTWMYVLCSVFFRCLYLKT